MNSRSFVRKRSRKAFRLTNRLLYSYAGLFLCKKLFGVSYYERRIEKTHAKNAARVKLTILELQGLFTKAGQLISTLSHILPDAYMESLESLQDDAPAAPFSETKSFLEQKLGAPITAVFKEFNEQAIASASIGRVYRGVLHSGEEVAVKVQHQNIEALAEADLEIIRKLIKRVSRFIRVQGLEHVYEQVRSMIQDELNYEKEANSMRTISENIVSVKGVRIPTVIDEYSSRRILVTSFETGVKITNTQQLDAWKIDRNELSERLILVYCKMILEDGFYHADPHPGNILVNQAGEIILIDFGAVAELSDEMRAEIPVLLQAILRKDQEKILLSLRKLGFIGNSDESELVAQQLIAALSQFLQNEVQINNLNLKDLSLSDLKGSSLDNLRKEISIRDLTKTIRIPKEWILLDRTIQLIMGTCATVAPELNPMDIIKPYLKKLLMKDGGIRTLILDAIKQQFTALLSLPSEISVLLKKANKGELVVRGQKNDKRIYALGQQFMLSLFVLSSFFMAYFSENRTFFVPFGIFSAILLRSIWKHRKA